MRGPDWGSPPRGRGKAASGSMVGATLRITPAWAGKRPHFDSHVFHNEDHPRVGGEKTHRTFTRAVMWGSPPRGRGKGPGDRASGCGLRITPAWAGKSPFLRSRFLLWGDHPRVGGEKSHPCPCPAGLLGSPPRGRGKVRRDHRRRRSPGITPAWAGKSGNCSTAGSSGKDHPRVGGEKCRATAHRGSSRGSPPRGRGKDAVEGHASRCIGITPAWAGKSD